MNTRWTEQSRLFSSLHCNTGSRGPEDRLLERSHSRLRPALSCLSGCHCSIKRPCSHADNLPTCLPDNLTTSQPDNLKYLNNLTRREINPTVAGVAQATPFFRYGQPTGHVNQKRLWWRRCVLTLTFTVHGLLKVRIACAQRHYAVVP